MSARRWWQGDKRIVTYCGTCGAPIGVGDTGAVALERRGPVLLAVCAGCLARRKESEGAGR